MEDKKKYSEAKKDAKRVVSYMAMDQKAREPVEKVDLSCDGREFPRKVGEKEGVVGVSCLKDEKGTVQVSVDDRMKILKELWKS